MSDSEKKEISKGSGGGEGETVQGITVKPIRTRGVDFERLLALPRTDLASLKTNEKLEIYMEGSCSYSSDEEVCAAEAPVSHAVPSKRRSKSATHDENVDVKPKIRKTQNF